MSLGTLGNLVVSLTAETAQFTGAMDKAAQQAHNRMRSMEAQAKVVGQAIGAGLLVGGTAFLALAKQAIDAQDALAKMSSRTSIAVENLAGLKLVADSADTSLDALATNVGRLQKFIGEAEGGNRQYQATLQNLGVTARDPVEAFYQLADATVALQDPNERAAALSQILGRGYQELLPLLTQGGEAIRKQVEYGRQLNPVTAESAAAAALFNDNITELHAAVQGYAVLMAGPFVQAMNDAVKAGKEAAVEYGASGGLQVGIGQLGIVGETVAVLWANVAYVFKQTGNEIGGIAAQLAALSRFDLSGAALIGDMMKEDAKQAREEFDALEARIMQVPKAVQQVTQEANAAAAGGITAPGLSTGSALVDAEKIQEQFRKAFDMQPMDDFVRNFQTRAKQIQREYDALIANLTGPSVEGATGGDIGAEITKGRGALARGDQTGVQVAAERAKAMLQGLQDNGGITYEITYYAQQLKQLELSANDAAASIASSAIKAAEEARIKALQDSMTADPLKLDLNKEYFQAQWKYMWDEMKRSLTEEPLQVPVVLAPQLSTGGGTSVDLSTLARSHGGR